MVKGFTEEEVNKHVEFLNYLAKNAKFDNPRIADQIELVKLFNWQQTVLVRKMQDLIVGEPKLHEPPKEGPKSPTTRKAK